MLLPKRAETASLEQPRCSVSGLANFPGGGSPGDLAKNREFDSCGPRSSAGGRGGGLPVEGAGGCSSPASCGPSCVRARGRGSGGRQVGSGQKGAGGRLRRLKARAEARRFGLETLRWTRAPRKRQAPEGERGGPRIGGECAPGLRSLDRTGSWAPGCKCIPSGPVPAKRGREMPAVYSVPSKHTRVKPRALKFLPFLSR